MLRIVLIALCVAALVSYLTFDGAHQQVVDANHSRCAAFAASDIDCPYNQ